MIFFYDGKSLNIEQPTFFRRYIYIYNISGGPKRGVGGFCPAGRLAYIQHYRNKTRIVIFLDMFFKPDFKSID